ncbi:MAG TPA: FtsX-like permease family protein [Streptosporangiaceae bacterium]|nr:FtsX-like permease family protein [Streptosporangiaceae bacterium]
MLRTTLASLRYRTARLVLSCLVIGLGVAFVTGTLVLGASMNQAYFDSFAAGAMNVDAAVTPAKLEKYRTGDPDAPSVPPSVLSRISAAAGVGSAAGRLVGEAPLVGSDGKVIRAGDRPGIGINVAADPALRGFTVASGHLPGAPGQVAVDRATAADEHFRLGQTVKVVDHAGRVRAFLLTGTVDFGANHAFGNAAVTVFETGTGFSVTGRPGYDQVVVRARPGTSQAALVATLRTLPGMSGYQVQTGRQLATAEANAAVQFTRQFTTFILVFALIAVAVACLVIYNTFTILITQRGRELALLRCVGASRGQVFRGTLLEAAVTGLVASAAGALAGVGLGWGLERVFAAFGASVPAGPLVLRPSAVAIAMAAGLAVTVASAVLPARSATRVAPVAALGGQHEQPESRKAGWLRVAAAVVFAAAGIGVTAAGLGDIRGTPGFVEIAAGGILCFLSVLALGPLIVPPAIAVLGWLLHLVAGPLTGPVSRLATANARRNPHRVAATTAALTIGLTLMTIVTVVVSSAQASADSQLAKHYPFDYVVQAGHGGQVVPFRVLDSLRASPALGVVADDYAGHDSVDGVKVEVGAIGRAAFGISVKPAVISGSLAAVGPGTVGVDSRQLGALGAHQGGTLAVATPRGTETFRVAAVYDSAGLAMPDVLMSVGDYRHAFAPAGASAVFVNARPGVPVATSRAAVDTAAARDPLLVVDTLADYKATLAGRVDQILALFGVLLGLAVLIALLGISNTLSLSVLERTRESALMRALGLTRGQLRVMLLTEALLMAALAIVLGAGLGVTFGAVMVHGFILSAAGQGVLSIPYAQIALYALTGVGATLAAAVLPARRAARTSVVAAMAEA